MNVELRLVDAANARFKGGRFADIQTDQVALAAARYWQKTYQKVGTYPKTEWTAQQFGPFKNWLIPPFSLFCALHPDWHSIKPGDIESVGPSIFVTRRGGSWLLVHVWEGHRKGTLFFILRTRDKGLQLVLIPSECEVDPDTMAISISSGGVTYRFLADVDPWPWPLLDPNAFIGLGQLGRFLTPLEDNPLTILLQSTGMPKGLALQIRNQLRVIYAQIARDIISHMS